MAGTLYLGTSGFAYDEWKGSFYPSGLSSRQLLGYYAGRFNSVELNYTFRREPSEAALAGWRRATPEGFLFAVKAHRGITHWSRLTDAGERAASFVARLRGLGARLGPVLFQCPPNLAFDRPAIESFLASLPGPHRYAFEFRHESWYEARPLLAAAGSAWCVADTDETPSFEGPLEARPFGYLRLRRTEYPDDALRAWAGRISIALAAGSDVFCYFKHEEAALGTRFAERLASMI
jgi:uncharacterized protein YecE (DUF72 family)